MIIDHRVKHLVEKICEQFDVELPTVVFSRRRNACYRPRQKKITISNRYAAKDVKRALVHEMAHHIDYQWNTDRKGLTPHGRQFFHILEKVVLFSYYGDITLYRWDLEYKTIAAWARIRGHWTKRKMHPKYYHPSDLLIIQQEEQHV